MISSFENQVTLIPSDAVRQKGLNLCVEAWGLCTRVCCLGRKNQMTKEVIIPSDY